MDGRRTAFSIRVPEILNKYYSNRHRTRNYSSYVSDTYDDRYIGSLVEEFESFGEKHGLSDLEIINQMMGFVQNLEYSRDKVSEGYNEYPKYPTETLVDRGGDCEDTCILLASLLEQFGYGTVLLAYFDDNHMALGLAGGEGIPGTYVEKGGQRYYYVETTSPGPKVGEAPEDLKNSTPEILPINDHPVLVFFYAVQPSAKGGVNIDGSIHNVGDATAQNAQLKVEFQDPSERSTVAATCESLTIPTDQDRSVNFPVQPPDNTEQRVKVSVLLDGRMHDSITSEYREPTNP